MFALKRSKSETKMLTEAYMYILALLSSDLHVTQNKTFTLNEKVRKFITKTIATYVLLSTYEKSLG